MGRFVLRRLVWALPTLLGICVITFAMIHIAPGGPVEGTTGAGGPTLGRREVEASRRLFFLDLPLLFNGAPRGVEARVSRLVRELGRGASPREALRCGTACLPGLLEAYRAAGARERARIGRALDLLREAHPGLGPPSAATEAWAAAVVDLLAPGRVGRSASGLGQGDAVQRVARLGTAALPAVMDLLLAGRRDAARVAASEAASKLTGIDGRLHVSDSAARWQGTLDRWDEWWFQHSRDYVSFSWWDRTVGRITETQFAKWIGRVATLRFGNSIRDGRPVGEKLAEALPVTLLLSLVSMALAYLIGVPLGIHSAVRQGRPTERVATVALFVLYSLPSFWVAMVLILLFGGVGHWDWFPIYGLSSEGLEHAGGWTWLVDRLHHMVLPVACLTYGSLAVISRYQRSSMLEVIRQDYIRTARARGLSERSVIFRHALRNSLLPVITLMGLQFPYLISGSVIIERIFNIPGMGMMTFDAFLVRDYPVIMAVSVLTAAMTLVGLILADLCYALVDPRIRLGEERT